jgi:hypothetical protein
MVGPVIFLCAGLLEDFGSLDANRASWVDIVHYAGLDFDGMSPKLGSSNNLKRYLDRSLADLTAVPPFHCR